MSVTEEQLTESLYAQSANFANARVTILETVLKLLLRREGRPDLADTLERTIDEAMRQTVIEIAGKNQVEIREDHGCAH